MRAGRPSAGKYREGLNSASTGQKTLLLGMKQEVPIKKLVIFLAGSILLISFTFYFYQVFFISNVLLDKEDRLFEVKSGTTYRDLQQRMVKEGFVNDLVSFSFVARLKGLDKKIKPGRYLLKKNMTNPQAVNAILSGRSEAVKITFSHARIMPDLADKITVNIGVTTNEFSEAINRFLATNQEGFTEQNIIAMFIPNTYEVYFNILPEDLVARFNKEYHDFWTIERLDKARALGLTPIEVSTLASIVQAEISKTEEAPRVAGLYLNRLKKDIALQADPTLVFAAGDFTIKRVLNEHKEIESPYNTYKYRGLPPGPINMPYISSIEAVLNYEKHNYYYMCAKEDFSGYHNFANSLQEHQRNASRYQRALSAELRKAAQKSK